MTHDKQNEIMLKVSQMIDKLELQNVTVTPNYEKGRISFQIKQLEWQDKKRRGLLKDVKYKEIPYGRYYSVEVNI